MKILLIFGLLFCSCISKPKAVKILPLTVTDTNALRIIKEMQSLSVNKAPIGQYVYGKDTINVLLSACK